MMRNPAQTHSFNILFISVVELKGDGCGERQFVATRHKLNLYSLYLLYKRKITQKHYRFLFTSFYKRQEFWSLENASNIHISNNKLNLSSEAIGS